MYRHLSSYMERYPQYTEFAVELRPENGTINMEVYAHANHDVPVVVQNDVEDWDSPVVLERITQKGTLRMIPTTVGKPTPDRTEGAHGAQTRWLTFTRPTHEVYRLKNSSGHNDVEEG